MKKIKDINWFWKNWTESEKKIYKKCTVFAVIVIMLEIVATIICANQFHAADAPPTYDDKDMEIPAEGIAEPPLGYHHETRWDDEKGEWYSVYVPDPEVTNKDLWDAFWQDEEYRYTLDDSGTLYLFKRMFNMIYAVVLPTTSVVACTLVGFHICMIMTSKNPRKIDTSYTAIKSVATTWLYIMCISVFITLAVQGFNAMINSPLANPIIHP